jgi:hypothetical protein
MAATRSDAVGFVVMLAGPGVPGLDILVEQGEIINEAAGAPPEITAMNGRVQRALAQIVRDEPDADVAALLMRTAMEAEIDALPEDIKQAAGAQLSASVDQSIQQMNTPCFPFRSWPSWAKRTCKYRRSRAYRRSRPPSHEVGIPTLPYRSCPDSIISSRKPIRGLPQSTSASKRPSTPRPWSS